MKETSRLVVNHIRVMIEEAETSNGELRVSNVIAYLSQNNKTVKKGVTPTKAWVKTICKIQGGR